MNHVVILSLYRLFLSPLAWIIIALSQLITAYFFLGHLDHYLSVQDQLSTLSNPPGVGELISTPFYKDTALILLLLIPVISQYLLTEEKYTGSLLFLLSAPLTSAEIILGKYLASLIFCCCLLACLSIMPLSLSHGTKIDYFTLLTGLLGLVLLCTTATAIALYCSSLTQHPAIATIISLTVLLLLWHINWNQQSSLLSWLSMHDHTTRLLQGHLHTQDIAYYAIHSMLFILLTIRRLAL